MTKQIDYCTQCFSKLIHSASSVLQLSFPEVKKRYGDYPICLMYYTEKNIKEDIIEIRFDSEQATLSCTFDMDSACKSSYLFLDHLECLTECIEYLNANYTYDYINCQWKLPDCWLSLKKTKDDTYMHFHH